jgi:PRC-barrel domain protein
MITRQQASDLIGAAAYDHGGNQVGEVATVYLDRASGEPEWLTVTTGLHGPRQTFAPIARAHLRGPREVEFDLDKDTITGAPSIDPVGEVSEICTGCGRYYDLPAEADQVMRVAVQQDGIGRVLVQCKDIEACDERWSSIVTCF